MNIASLRSKNIYCSFLIFGRNFINLSTVKEAMGKLVLGVDEAGRGAVVGALCIAAVVVDENDSRALKNLGVKDSKKLSRKRREELEDGIKEIADDLAVVRIPAEVIDEEMDRKSLNRIEVERIAELINALQPDLAVVDAPEAKTGKVEREILSLINDGLKDRMKLEAENHADENYPIVSAASILAKVTRDNSLEDLERDLNEEIGNGYPSDQRTVNFLESCLDSSGDFPQCVRKGWITAKRLVGKREQNDLSKFCGVENGPGKEEEN